MLAMSGQHQAHGSVEDAVIQGVKVALPNQQRADFMEDVIRRIEVRRVRLLKHGMKATLSLG